MYINKKARKKTHLTLKPKIKFFYCNLKSHGIKNLYLDYYRTQFYSNNKNIFMNQ